MGSVQLHISENNRSNPPTAIVSRKNGDRGHQILQEHPVTTTPVLGMHTFRKSEGVSGQTKNQEEISSVPRLIGLFI
jgi:hypothetical protein